MVLASGDSDAVGVVLGIAEYDAVFESLASCDLEAVGVVLGPGVSDAVDV